MRYEEVVSLVPECGWPTEEEIDATYDPKNPRLATRRRHWNYFICVAVGLVMGAFILSGCAEMTYAATRW
ncbi:hypothetical protein ABZ714_24745 [Streptomyces sp. NPDC006798]|uniref:hypothetical protein n=1 Tax=Streptomyces sp. NPDC006798 TaxID=3155462 RepID=UPI0033D6C15A